MCDLWKLYYSGSFSPRDTIYNHNIWTFIFFLILNIYWSAASWHQAISWINFHSILISNGVLWYATEDSWGTSVNIGSGLPIWLQAIIWTSANFCGKLNVNWIHRNDPQLNFNEMQ